MILPQEMEVFYVIPAIRKELAHALVNSGLKQKEVAKIFGVTEACVSNYFKSKRGNGVKFTPKIIKVVNKCANELKQGKSCFISIVQRVCKEFKQSQGLCRLHKKLDSHVCGTKCCVSTQRSEATCGGCLV